MIVGSRADLVVRPWHVRRDRGVIASWPDNSAPFYLLWSHSTSSLGTRWRWAVDLVQKDDTITIGCISLREMDYPMSCRLGIVFSPAWSGQGYGTKAMREFLHNYWWMGFDVLFADVHPTNIIALRMYKRLGFSKLGSNWRPAPNGFDMLLLPKELRNSHLTRYDEYVLKADYYSQPVML